MSRIEELELEIKDLRDKYLRALADNENMRKSIEKEEQKSDHISLITALNELRPLLQKLEEKPAPMEELSEELRSYGVGINMCLKQLKEIMAEAKRAAEGKN